MLITNKIFGPNKIFATNEVSNIKDSNKLIEKLIGLKIRKQSK